MRYPLALAVSLLLGCGGRVASPTLPECSTPSGVYAPGPGVSVAWERPEGGLGTCSGAGPCDTASALPGARCYVARSTPPDGRASAPFTLESGNLR